MTRFWIILGFGVLMTVSFFKVRSDAQPDSFTQVVPGVWFRQGDIDHKGHCNNAVIEMQDGLFVVDANYPSGARALMEDIKKVSSKPVKFVFDTHHHGDHAYGNPVWTKIGAITLAYVGVAQEMKRYEPARWQGENRPDVKELGLSTAEPPQKTFDKSPYVIEDSMRRIELHFFGWAHTRGDGFAYLPKEKVLCTGDAVINGPYNNVNDGNIGNWPKVIAQLQRKDVQYVLPGHGPRGGKEVLAGQKLFFEELRRAVAKEVMAGKKLNEIVTFEGKNAKSTSVKLSEAVKTWVGDEFAHQVEMAYREASEGKAAGDLH